MSQMLTITAIKPTLKDPTRWSIKVGRKFVGALPQTEIEALGLKVDMPWTAELMRRVDQAAQYDKVYRSAIFRIGRRMYSTADLAQKLKMSKYQPTPQVVEQVIEKCQSLGLLDDEVYGRALIRNLQISKPAGPRLLQTKLMQKGLDRQLIERLIRETQVDRDDFNAAMGMAQKKWPSLGSLPVQKARQRLYGQLARRGFEMSTISQVMENLDWDSLADATEDQWD